MSIQQLATQGRDRLHSGLAAVDTALLSHMRDESLRSCFRRIEQTPHRMQHVACIYRKEYIDDSASRQCHMVYAAKDTGSRSLDCIWPRHKWRRNGTARRLQPVVACCVAQGADDYSCGRRYEDASPDLPCCCRTGSRCRQS